MVKAPFPFWLRLVLGIADVTRAESAGELIEEARLELEGLFLL